MEQIKGGVTKAKGYLASACAAGIKYQGRRDMALFYSERPCCVAGVFTTNVVKAAPVKWDRQVVEAGRPVQAVVVNSGIANACTGSRGMDCCREEAHALGEMLGLDPEGILIGSTGVIGMELPMDRVKAGMACLARELQPTEAAGSLAAQAIMTTDTLAKERAARFTTTDGKEVTIGGMAKGSGMIHPNMCTMLSFLTTDAAISREALQAALSEDVRDTYNMISIDGDTSTNDTVLLLANGAAGNQEIQKDSPDYRSFCQALRLVTEDLAKLLAGDGEGATALFEVTVKGAKTKEEARTLAKSVIGSNLTKAAIAGHDANWGRILCALGYAGVSFDPEKVDLFFSSEAGTLQIMENGVAVDYREEEATRILKAPYVNATADLKEGGESATAWGCDLTVDYVKINADYRS